MKVVGGSCPPLHCCSSATDHDPNIFQYIHFYPHIFNGNSLPKLHNSYKQSNISHYWDRTRRYQVKKHLFGIKNQKALTFLKLLENQSSYPNPRCLIPLHGDVLSRDDAFSRRRRRKQPFEESLRRGVPISHRRSRRSLFGKSEMN